MRRILGIELRRSAAAGSALALAVTGVVLLYFAEGIAFSTGWMQLAMTQRLYLALLWPLALAAGAWQARREHRSRVADLFASTPRPPAQRAVPVLVAMAVAVTGAYLAMGAGGGVWIADTAEYLPVRVLVVTAVGVLSLIAAVWLGLAVGRLVPRLVTAPALAIAGLALLLLIPAATRPRGWLALVFSPIYEMNMPGAYATVPGRVSAAQTVWLLALAVGALILFAAGRRRTRVAALLPVLLGAALAIAVMPHQNRQVTDAVDPVAKELVCAEDEPRLCVSRVHSGLLPELTGPVREALTVLSGLPGAPTRVHEDTTTFPPQAHPEASDDVVLLRVEAGPDGHAAKREQVIADTVRGAFAGPPTCDVGIPPADLLAAAYWLIGREPVAGPAPDEPDLYAEAAGLWRRLGELPADEARHRVAALRAAALQCAADGRLFPGSAP